MLLGYTAGKDATEQHRSDACGKPRPNGGLGKERGERARAHVRERLGGGLGWTGRGDGTRRHSVGGETRS